MGASVFALPASRAIVTLSPLDVDELARGGMFPRLPDEIDSVARSPRARDPRLDDIARYHWCGVWERNRSIVAALNLAAVAAFERMLDPHTSRDVLHVVHIAGTRRGVVDVCRHIIDVARAEDRGVTGDFDACNAQMIALAARLGLKVLDRVSMGLGLE